MRLIHCCQFLNSISKERIVALNESLSNKRIIAIDWLPLPDVFEDENIW